jgi:hypothetical protein
MSPLTRLERLGKRQAITINELTVDVERNNNKKSERELRIENKFVVEEDRGCRRGGGSGKVLVVTILGAAT